MCIFAGRQLIEAVSLYCVVASFCKRLVVFDGVLVAVLVALTVCSSQRGSEASGSEGEAARTDGYIYSPDHTA